MRSILRLLGIVGLFVLVFPGPSLTWGDGLGTNLPTTTYNYTFTTQNQSMWSTGQAL